MEQNTVKIDGNDYVIADLPDIAKVAIEHLMMIDKEQSGTRVKLKQKKSEKHIIIFWSHTYYRILIVVVEIVHWKKIRIKKINEIIKKIYRIVF